MLGYLAEGAQGTGGRFAHRLFDVVDDAEERRPERLQPIQRLFQRPASQQVGQGAVSKKSLVSVINYLVVSIMLSCECSCCIDVDYIVS